jgi:AcrR family transcriptional regulator
MQLDTISETEAPEARREALLGAAVGVFARYGYRKTSMDEVARAAGVSRQGLYLQFADKEALFRKAVDLETRLIAACDEWAGRAVGTMGGDAADLMCASTSLAGATLADFQAQFENALARTIGASPLVEFCAASGFTATDVARALHATARGLKHSSESRQEFLQGMTVAARLFCAPLKHRS